jgi:hypothetical protein
MPLMRRTRTLALLTIAVAAFGLAGCSFSIGNAHPVSVSSDRVAEVAEDALEEQVGQRPDIDCGSEDVPLEEDASRTCVLTDPASGTEYDAEVVLSDIDGDTFHVDVQVADTPRP